MSTIAPTGATRTRPKTPHYGIERQEEGMLNWDWVDDQMAKSHNYWVCTARPDGRPHAAPVWGVWLGSVLYFGIHRQSVKGRNLAKQPQAVIHLESGDDTVIFEGELIEVNIAEVPGFADAYEAKYKFRPDVTGNDPDMLYVKLVPGVVMAWQEVSFPKTATRWEFD